MESRSSRSKPHPPPQPQPSPAAARRGKVIGGGLNALKLSEDVDASKLIGSVLEKGISEAGPLAPSSVPRPSVIPFPVARHRSHGPYWAPKVGEGRDICVDDDDYDEEEHDVTNYNPIANFANPMQRKKKKGLDLSNWRELVSDITIPDSHKKEEDINGSSGMLIPTRNGEAMDIYDVTMNPIKPSRAAEAEKRELSEPMNMDKEGIDVHSGARSTAELERLGIPSKTVPDGKSKLKSSDRILSDSVPFYENKSRGIPVDADVRMEDRNLSHRSSMLETKFSSSLFGSFASDEGCLQSQIDAENRTLLETMSADEIAEAQVEIRSKMNPKLLEVLKRRGQEKLEKKKGPALELSAKNGLGLDDAPTEKHLKQVGKASEVHESNNSYALQNTETGLDRSTVQSYPQSSSRLWDAWSERVEAVRDLRFSVYGDVVRTSFCDVPEAGKTSDQSGYSVENVGERDPLRTEGDPGAAGYTIKEAVALMRSIFPAQRAFALHLLSSVLNNASLNISKTQVGCNMVVINNMEDYVDWEAIWAFSLGPEPELVLSLRLALDDKHDFVVLACAEAIKCILAFDLNEDFFDISEKVPGHLKDLYTGPVFRARSKINLGYLHSGFWKYNTKPSNILLLDEDLSEENSEGGRTIQDDNVVAGQDIAAGLVRMVLLPRLYSLLETCSTLRLEEAILSILIAVARVSPACSTAILECQGLVDVVVERFMTPENANIHSTKIKSVMLLRVLAQSNRRTCMQFITDGIFQKVTWQLYCTTSSIDGWVKLGREHCKLASKLMVEQLRLWRVCINYGHCVSYFTAIFPAMCLWLNLPSVDTLVRKNILREFCSISSEAYLVLAALANRLPSLSSQQSTINQLQHSYGDGGETWCWSDVSPMVDLALKWIALSSLSKLFDLQTGTDGKSCVNYDHVSSLLWVISAALRMLSAILIKAAPMSAVDHEGNVGVRKPLPHFVAEIGYLLVKNGFLSFTHGNVEQFSTEANADRSFVDKLCHLRSLANHEVALAAVCCLHEVSQLLVAVDRVVQLGETGGQHFSSRSLNSLEEGRIIEKGIIKSSLSQWRVIVIRFMKLVVSEWHLVHSIEVFGRGGPAPGVGIGWGASGGGFWSSTVLLAQADASFLIDLLHTVTYSSGNEDPPKETERTVYKQMVISALAVCLTAGPSDGIMVKKAFDFLLQNSVLKYLNLSIHQFFHDSLAHMELNLEFGDHDFVLFRDRLAPHFCERWLSVKQRKRKETDNGMSGLKNPQISDASLETIPEDMDVDMTAVTSEAPASLAVEWAHQRLPLPEHWFLSPLTTLGKSKDGSTLGAQGSAEVLEVTKAGLFFLLGLEVLSCNISDEDPFLAHSPVSSVPLVWKLHALSVVLLPGMAVLEEGSNRDVYEALQFLYGRQLDESRVNRSCMDLLRFQSEIDSTYTTTFIDTLVEQFAADSFGDLHYGRQVAIYLHRQVESPVRLAVWNALSNTRVLDLLPPLDKSVADAVGYLDPVEEEVDILQAYVKSWVSGSLDKAKTRGSMTYTLVVHHLSSFIFKVGLAEKIPLRNKIVKSLLRDYSQKQQHQAMLLELIRYRADFIFPLLGQNGYMNSDADELNRRLQILTDACDSSLLPKVEKLKPLLQSELSC